MVVELIAPITLGAWLEGNQVVDASMGQSYRLNCPLFWWKPLYQSIKFGIVSEGQNRRQQPV